MQEMILAQVYIWKNMRGGGVCVCVCLLAYMNVDGKRGISK